MAKLEKGSVVYDSVWEVNGGDIQFSIQRSVQLYTGMVTICYRNSQNSENKIQNDLNEI